VDSPYQVLTQGSVNRPMPLYPAHTCKSSRCDCYTKVALPAFLISRMPPVKLAFIFYFKNMRLKRRFQFRPHLICHTHFSHLASSSFEPRR
jgi:hypothetical protein